MTERDKLCLAHIVEAIVAHRNAALGVPDRCLSRQAHFPFSTLRSLTVSLVFTFCTPVVVKASRR